MSNGLVKKIAVGTVVSLALGAAAVAAFWTDIQTYRALTEFRTADAEGRGEVAARLAEIGEPAIPGLLDCLRAPDAGLCADAAAVLSALADSWGPTDPRTLDLAGRLFALYPSLGDEGQLALLRALPAVRQTGGPGHAQQRAAVVRSALTHASPEHRITGIKLALWPEVALLADVAPLLKADEPEVRAAAMLAVGPLRPDAPALERDLVRTDDLLAWLHDPDAEVRRICEMSLLSRGLSDVEIRRGRLLTHPEPAERTKLFADLMRDDQIDLGTWLDRLSRDPHASVRASAARAIGETNLHMRDRLEQMGRDDPDATVRRIAEFYRKDVADTGP